VEQSRKREQHLPFSQGKGGEGYERGDCGSPPREEKRSFFSYRGERQKGRRDAILFQSAKCSLGEEKSTNTNGGLGKGERGEMEVNL